MGRLNHFGYYTRAQRVITGSDEEILLHPDTVETTDDNEELMLPGGILLPPEASYEINCIVKEKIINEGHNIFPFQDAKTIWLEKKGLSFTDGTDGKITVGTLIYQEGKASNQFVYLGRDETQMKFIRPGGNHHYCHQICLDYWKMVKV